MLTCDLCGSLAMTGNICTRCALKGPADQFDRAVSINLQLNTVEEMIQRFVIENHQVKHYAGGNRDWSHFDSEAGSLDWREVHQVVVYGVRESLKLQKAAGLVRPIDGYVRFTDLGARGRWYAGRGNGYTDVVRVRVLTSLKNGFEGHGFPLDQTRYHQLGNEAFVATGTLKDALKVSLSGANNSIRIMKIGA